jgi:hypothetical protein
MTELVNNEFGMEYVHTPIIKLRIHRTDRQWLVEYKREPRWWCPWDRIWWYNDGKYVEYKHALERVDYLKSVKYVSTAQFQNVKEFNIQ